MIDENYWYTFNLYKNYLIFGGKKGIIKDDIICQLFVVIFMNDKITNQIL